MKNGGHPGTILRGRAAGRERSIRRSHSLRKLIFVTPLTRISAVVLLFLFVWSGSAPVLSQSASQGAEVIKGIVINSSTGEPIPRALVSSPDNRFATLSNSEGRFEFPISKQEPRDNNPSNSPVSASQEFLLNRPGILMARKPGFIDDPNSRPGNMTNSDQELVLKLVPESLIVGSVSLPTGEAPDSLSVQIYRRTTQNGHPTWLPVRDAQAHSDGQFRFAGLTRGVYRLFSQEMLDQDAPIARRDALYGYPPAYYQTATDFESATDITLGTGETYVANISLIRQRYYPIQIHAISGSDPIDNGLNANVFANGHRGPGFSLGYDNNKHEIVGSLPNGNYTIEATSFGPNPLSGSLTISVKGAPVVGPRLVLSPGVAIEVRVTEQFTSRTNAVTTSAKSAAQIANVSLEPAAGYGILPGFSSRRPHGNVGDTLLLDGVSAGSYWVRVDSMHGYAASVRSGDLDLLHQPFVVSVGGGASPIEVVMRDDTAEVSGTVDTSSGRDASATHEMQSSSSAGVFIYGIPLADSPGHYFECVTNADGTFQAPEVAPGGYRLLAFDAPQPDLDYRDATAMGAYDSSGVVIHLVGGQKETVQLRLISSFMKVSGQ